MANFSQIFQSNKQSAYLLPIPTVLHQAKCPTYTTHYSSTNCAKWYGMAVHKGVFPNRSSQPQKISNQGSLGNPAAAAELGCLTPWSKATPSCTLQADSRPENSWKKAQRWGNSRSLSFLSSRHGKEQNNHLRSNKSHSTNWRAINSGQWDSCSH